MPDQYRPKSKILNLRTVYYKDDLDTWLAGLTVPAATTSTYGSVKQAAAVADLSGSPAAADNQTKINALLASLRTAGVLAT